MRFLLGILLLFSSLYEVKPFSYLARNYIVYDYNSKEIIEGKDYHSQYSVASISKIMTAIIAIESDRLFEVVEVNEIIYTIEGSSLYLEVGDKITLLDLVYGLLLRSGNDAAVLIAQHVSSEIKSFVSLMNSKAKEIGMENTIFSNPSGLDIYDEGNSSTCFDMALLMAYCMDNPLFREITRSKSYRSSLKGLWTNKNKLIHEYKYCIGGKTGYTKKARRTLITQGEKDYDQLIVVTFDSSNDFAFHKEIYQRYLEENQYLVFLNKGINYIDQYYIYSDRVIGIRIKKSITSGVKIYHLNPISNTLKIKFVCDDFVYVVEEEYLIDYSVNL